MHVWAVFGTWRYTVLFLWHAWHVRWGTRRSLVVALPAMAQSSLAYIATALFVRGTFMGTVTIAMPAARRV